MNRCALCPAKHNVVPPSGPEESDVIFIGEAPGPRVRITWVVPFVGKTGEEVNQSLSAHCPDSGGSPFILITPFGVYWTDRKADPIFIGTPAPGNSSYRVALLDAFETLAGRQ